MAATDDSPAIPEHIIVETPMNMSPTNKAHFEAEKEAIHLILTGIGEEIYSTIDACETAQEMWEVIERLQQDMVRLVVVGLLDRFTTDLVRSVVVGFLDRFTTDL
nr:hypothetical protein [Tanacetum cinerariifolium]